MLKGLASSSLLFRPDQASNQVSSIVHGLLQLSQRSQHMRMLQHCKKGRQGFLPVYPHGPKLECTATGPCSAPLSLCPCCSGAFGGKPKTCQFNACFSGPELLQGECQDSTVRFSACQHDMWSLGALFHYMLTSAIWCHVPLDLFGEIDWMEIHALHAGWVGTASARCCPVQACLLLPAGAAVH